MKKFSRSLQLLFSFILCYAAGGIGQLFTYKEISTWYPTLQKAPFNPPGWVFGPVWTILYAFVAISLFLILEKRKSIFRKWGLIFFFTQLILNTLWTLIFFGAHATAFAFIDLLLMILATILTMFIVWKISRGAVYLLVPYLLWISFASILNFFVVILNP